MELTIAIEDLAGRAALFGSADGNLRLIRAALDVQVSARDSSIKLTGSAEAVGKAAKVIEALQRLLRETGSIGSEDVSRALADASKPGGAARGEAIEVFASNAPIFPKTKGQRAYVEAIRGHDLTFCLGPAGTGKTYLAVALGVSMLKQNQIKRIVLVRPAVEAGEKLGYLPGDMQAKVNPYLRPLFDAMHDMMTFEQIKRFMQNDVIEVIPLAFMRGRTLSSAVIILDEAQNTTVLQMLMFLTRLGHHSKMIVTGDDSQIDLEPGQTSGVRDATRRLTGIDGIAIVRLREGDIVRHALVQNIVEAYGNGRADRS
ncbi:MAG TPA: PhoH family protein [Phycisphaerae bacterium]|nr:PhoH family protein [Phycisphaerae bacterium]